MSALTQAYGYGLGPVDDFFGLASANLKLVASKKTPHALSLAKAEDRDGNELAETKYGTDTIFDVENEYDLVKGTLNTGTLLLGLIVAGSTGIAPLFEAILESIAVKTSNGAWPKLTVKGAMIAAASPNGVSSLFTNLSTFTCPSFTVYGKKSAQLFGFTLASGAEITTGGFSFDGKIEWHTETGVTLAGALTGAEFKADADSVEITAAPAFTAVSPFAAGDVIQKPGRDAKATGYATSKVEATVIVIPITTTTSL